MILFPCRRPRATRRYTTSALLLSAWGVAALTLLGGGTAQAAPHAAAASDDAYTWQSPSEQYLATRHSFPPVTGLTPVTLAENPDRWRGMTLELEGRLSGIVRTDEGAILMLATDRYGTLTLTMSRLPDWLEPGDRLRVLAVGTGAGSDVDGTVPDDQVSVSVGIANMQVVCVASSSDIYAAEMRWQRMAQARTAEARRREAALQAASESLMSRRNASLASRSRSRMDATPISGLAPSAVAVYYPYRDFIWHHNPRLTASQADAITSSILLFSARYDVDPRLVIALIIAESDFDVRSTSNKGAMGLGQIMPDEAHDLGLTNPYDPVQNVAGSIYLLRTRLDHYSGGLAQKDLTTQHIVLALASYNAGMGAVKKYGGVPPYRETQNYVRKITRLYQQLCANDGAYAAAANGGRG